MKQKISVVINTLNEEENISYALRSVHLWADEIVVVDMHSIDRTVEIARDFGAKVFFHEPIGFSEPARAFAISQSTGDWVLILDADELIPAALSQKLLKIAVNDTADVIVIPMLNYLLGAPLLHTGWGPEQAKHARFFKRGMLQTNSKIHDYLKPVPGARIFELTYQPDCAMVHFNYIDVKQFIEKLNRYTTIEAKQAYERGDHYTLFKMLLYAIKEFLSRYIKNQGYLDGWRGFYISVMMGFYRLSTSMKLKELEVNSTRSAIERFYQHEAEAIIDTYNNEEANG
jgi:glycosyltransferase involved in cell wall biosynthesis